MKPIHILLVEDNEGDILLTIEALKEEKNTFTISVVRDGWEAIQFLNKKGKYINEFMPDVILLDINLPKVNGIEVLKNIKNNKLLLHIPINILTTSSSPEDIKICLYNKADFFTTKPLNANQFYKDFLSLNKVDLLKEQNSISNLNNDPYLDFIFII